MSLFSIFCIAISLSFDAMAVGAASGARDHQMSFSKAARIAFFFGLFQFLMPLIGWYIGAELSQFISIYGHWIVFILLNGLGIKFIAESLKPVAEKEAHVHSWKILILLSIATSIDALVVGITFAFLPIKIWQSLLTIGFTTFVLSLVSVYVGKKFGERWGKKAEIAGGLALVLIGCKILLEHLLR